MNTQNTRTIESPYAPPQTVLHEVKPSIVFWIAGCIFSSMIVGSVLGLVLGVVIGKFAPGYYQAMFSSGTSTPFDPVGVGMGLGLTQGAVFGTVTGVISVGLFLWYRSRCGQVRI